MHSQSKPTAPGIDVLLAHDDWLRRVLATLVAEHQIDDVLQDTWLAALERQPQTGARTWLRVVARRMAARSRRADTRRQRREHAVVREDVSASTDHVVQRLELRQRVTRAVLELREPYRSTLLQRFYEDKTPAQIAGEQGISAATVRSRLHRALRMLRDALGDSQVAGVRRAVPAIAAAAARPDAAVTRFPLLETVLMTTKMKLCGGLVAMLLLGGLVVLWQGSGASSVPDSSPVADASGGALQIESPAGDTMADDVVRQSVPESPAVAAAEPSSIAPAVESLWVEGFVRDPVGAPLAAVDIYRRGGVEERGVERGTDHTVFDSQELGWSHVGRSEADGSFRVAVEERSGWLVAGPPYIAIRPWPVGKRMAPEASVVVAAPAVSLGGTVTDEQGRPLGSVAITGFCERITSYPGVLDHNPRPDFAGGVTNEQGRFSISRVPACAAVVYTFALEAHESVSLPAPSQDSLDLRIVLRSHDAAGAHLFTGRVLDPAGEPVAGATVGLGEARVKSGDDGVYRLAVPEIDDDEVLFAVAAGFLAAVEREAVGRASQSADTQFADLRLVAAHGVIAGRVLRPDGVPWPGLKVYPWDLGYLGSSQFTREGWEVGADHKWIGGFAVTDDTGAFELGGLDDRTYVLRLLDESAPLGLLTEPIAAGSRDVEIRIADSAVRAEVRGVVVDSAGRGVEGVLVNCDVGIRLRDGQGVTRSGAGARTDASGAFVLRSVPRAEANLTLDGEAIMPRKLRLEPEEAGVGLRLVVARRCRLRVEALSAPDGARFSVLDDNGKKLVVRQFTGGGHIYQYDWAFEGGRTQVLTAPDTARVIVLHHEGQVLERRDLTLRSGVVTEVRF